MPNKSPHISIAADQLMDRVLEIAPNEFKTWPESIRDLALALAEELFLIRYNPFIPADLVWRSVQSRLRNESFTLTEEYFHPLKQALDRYWAKYQADMEFRRNLVENLGRFMPADSIVSSAHTLVECATDATDLRMELPLLVLFPADTDEIRRILILANEMGFSVVPRGGGSGLTGGAVPGNSRAVVLSLSKMKKITRVDREEMALCAQSGVITLNAIQAAAKKGMLLTVDPASKAASSLGGNISENAGGPFAFEYGTTLDNILSYTMVQPTGSIRQVRRKDHPRHKILPNEKVVFEILDENGSLLKTLEMQGSDFRAPGLGKDVTNKYLGGLPGVQKEGLDGIITEACFTLHPRLAHSRTLCLEFFGKSMHNAMLVIKDIVNLRDAIRKQGDLVKISALEEFGTKYVQAIEYEKKSSTYEGEPISVLLLQLDSDDAEALDEAVRNIVDIADPYDKVDIFAARDEREAERFWEDRHRLSAITRRTSGFKINEDVVIPLEVIPQFSDYIESLNLYYLALAYRRALEEAGQLKGIDVGDEFINMEMDVATSIIRNEQASRDLSEQEFAVQIHYFFQDLRNRYPKHKDDLKSILDRLQSTRIIVANHMHAGDGNCHVNIPVNSNDPDMMHLAEDAAERIFAKVVELKGGVSGEHGIGITKIAFLPEEKISDIREYKKKIDPNNVLNPGKLIQRELPVKPYTFSFNRLILDIDKTALPGKEILIRLLSNIQTCSRCGKCKQVCPMYYPEQGIMFHPRNKNITFGALVEALYYSQIIRKKPDPQLLGEMRNIVEHCTACGKCMAICPVKINSSEVTLELRSFLDEKAASGHPVKNRILNFLAAEPEKRIPQAAKFAAVGQNIQNRSIGLVPSAWRKRAVSPILRGPGPDLGFTNLQESLKANQGSIFLPADHSGDAEGVFYFPGCGASLFYRSIGLAGLRLLLAAGVPVALPPKHLCCGYPLLSAGCESAYKKNRARNITALKELFARAEESGVRLKAVLTSCGTCRESLESCRLADRLSIPGLIHRDVVQFLLKLLPQPVGRMQEDILYHQSCHTEFSDVSPAKAGDIYASGLADFSGRKVEISKGCCGESGMGALTSPKIYNTLRARKKDTLEKDLAGKPRPLLVSCPSCKVGLTRTLKEMDKDQPVLHTLEYLADQVCGKAWQEDILSAVSQAQVVNGTRLVRI